MKEFDQLVNILATLRGPNGCEWDRAQDIGDLKSHLLEEVYELIDAIDSGQTDKVKEEVGDVVMLLVFVSQLYKEKEKFSIEDALHSIGEKLIVRHPHVFAGKNLKDKKEIVSHWIKEKAKTKKRKIIKERLPTTAPALLLGYLYFKEKGYLNPAQDRAQLGSKIEEKMKELPGSLEKGSVIAALFTLVEAAAFLKVDLECELRKKVLESAAGACYPAEK